jgi:hypothetical protein
MDSECRRGTGWQPVLQALALAVAACWLAAPAAAVELPTVVSKSVFVASPGPGTAVWANTFYTRGTGQDKMAVAASEHQSDVYVDWKQCFSTNNGRSWTAWETMPGVSATMLPQPGWVDPQNGRMLTIMLDQNNPNSAYSLRCRVSDDGGHNYAVDQPIHQAGHTPQNPFDGIEIGIDSMCVGAMAGLPVRTSQDRVLVPVQITKTANERYDSAVLLGTWQEDGRLAWTMSQRVLADPARSPRGYMEPTLMEMPGPNGQKRILMVMRGNNASNPNLPGYKWYSVSTDGGQSWSPTDAWTYDDGSHFYSPSSCSQLLRHSNGKYYWLGNILPANPSDNDPRYPMVMGQLDPNSLLLLKDTVTVLDTLGAGDPASLQLSNFTAHEDRLTGEIVLSMTRYMPYPNWVGDSYIYRIAVHAPEPSCIKLLLSGFATAAGLFLARAKRADRMWGPVGWRKRLSSPSELQETSKDHSVPPCFNSQSALNFEVKPGDNTADFEVSSKCSA